MKRVRFTEEQIIAVLREQSMLDQAALKELLAKKW